MALISMEHRIALTFDSAEDAEKAYAALEPHVRNLILDHVRGNSRAEDWVVQSNVGQDSTPDELAAIARVAQEIGEVDQDAKEAWDERDIASIKR